MSSLSRDELVTALQAHRNNDVYVIAETYPNGDDDSMGEPFYTRLAATGVRYDPSTDCLLIDATGDYR